MEGDVETPAGYREGYRLDTSLSQGAVVMFGVFSVVAWVV
jgi:hypothetical protein